MAAPTESTPEVLAPVQPSTAPELCSGILERSAVLRGVLLVAGLVLPQVVLYGPSLCGRKILLPLRILASPHTYLPRSQIKEEAQPQDQILSDLVFTEQPAREFGTGELRSGRLPWWDPLSYAGAPFAVFGTYAPFEMIYLAWPSPAALAWMQLAKAVVAGLGAYLFFRRVLGVGAVPALAGAWCYPVTGFLLLWQGFTVTHVVVWLPWLLLAAGRVIARPGGWGGPGLAAVTACALLGGHLDIAGQALLACGLFALWALIERYGTGRRLIGPGLTLTAAWAVGFGLAAPYWLPLVQYARTGDRMYRRQAGSEERPPAGLAVLPQTVVPLFYGAPRTDSAYVGETGNLIESAAGTYAGLLATLLAAPLAWCGRHRRQAWFWLGLGVLGLSWQLNLPGVVELLRLPGIRMLSHNRFVFVTGFALLTLAVCGLDELTIRVPERRWWFAVPAGLLVVLGGACVVRSTESAEHLARRIEQKAQDVTHLPPGRITDMQARRIHATFLRAYSWGLALSAAGLLGWVLIARGRRLRPWFAPALGAAMLVELLVFGWDLNPQSDPALYYPRLRILEQLAQAPPGRILPVVALPADLHKTHGLRTICGYDSVDPHLLVELLYLVREPSVQPLEYARLRSYVPLIKATADLRPELPRILDMLNVRYLLFYRPPDPAEGVRPLMEWEDYWVVENPNSLPRAYVPRRVATLSAGRETLAALAAKDFDPREVAYVTQSVPLPGRCAGKAAVTAEEPCRVEVAADMETPGLLVLADQWYDGWSASVNGRPVPILRTNHALRGVLLPAGHSIVRFEYRPPGFTNGVRLLAIALLGLVAWAAWLLARRRPAAGAPAETAFPDPAPVP